MTGETPEVRSDKGKPREDNRIIDIIDNIDIIDIIDSIYIIDILKICGPEVAHYHYKSSCRS